MANYFLEILDNPECAFLNTIGTSSAEYQAMSAPTTSSISRRE